MRRLSPWLLALPLAVAGSQAAHSFAYRLVYLSAARRDEVLAKTGHGYFHYAPLAVGFAAALCLLALAMRFAAARRGSPSAGPRAALFALVPLLTFTFQEHLERLFSEGSFPWNAALEPTFVVGLLLQLPSAFLAYRLVRLLLRGADALAHALAADLPRIFPEPVAVAAPVFVARPRIPVLARGGAGRAPPPR